MHLKSYEKKHRRVTQYSNMSSFENGNDDAGGLPPTLAADCGSLQHIHPDSSLVGLSWLPFLFIVFFSFQLGRLALLGTAQLSSTSFFCFLIQSLHCHKNVVYLLGRSYINASNHCCGRGRSLECTWSMPWCARFVCTSRFVLPGNCLVLLPCLHTS